VAKLFPVTDDLKLVTIHNQPFRLFNPLIDECTVMLTLFSVHEKSYLASCPDDACTGKGGFRGYAW
jgi:hypothetical protein